MDSKMGKLIVIEGVDGSGKTTQAELIRDYMIKNKNDRVKLISFPNYNNDSSKLVQLYLNGEICDVASDVNAYAASSFYACDRYINFKKEWEQYYNQGYTIISTRYVTSNAIHQTPKLDDSEWDNYINWLYDYEHIKLGLPIPDMVIYLHMDRLLSEKLIMERSIVKNIKLDIHEKDNNYMEKCHDIYKYISKKFNFKVIECYSKDQILSREIIFEKIMSEIRKVLFI